MYLKCVVFIVVYGVYANIAEVLDVVLVRPLNIPFCIHFYFYIIYKLSMLFHHGLFSYFFLHVTFFPERIRRLCRSVMYSLPEI